MRGVLMGGGGRLRRIFGQEGESNKRMEEAEWLLFVFILSS
jgi:hypothetical protein